MIIDFDTIDVISDGVIPYPNDIGTGPPVPNDQITNTVIIKGTNAGSNIVAGGGTND